MNYITKLLQIILTVWIQLKNKQDFMKSRNFQNFGNNRQNRSKFSSINFNFEILYCGFVGKDF
jgi:hypothetical protein